MSAKNPIAPGIEKLLRIGRRPNVVQIVPPRGVMRPPVIHKSDPPGLNDLVVHPLASPTGPGGAAGFSDRGGSTIQQPEVTNVYLGAFWGDQTFVEGFSKAVVENGYLDPLSELNYGSGSGTYVGPVSGPALNAGSTFTDDDARSTVTAMLDAGTIQANANSLFMLILPDGVVSELDGAQSCNDYCGYHDSLSYNGEDIAYAVLPSTLCQGCGGEIGDFTAVYGHELAEACTDKVPGQGWVADDGEENADLEAWVLFGWGPPSNPNLYTVQGYYTNERGDTVGAWRDTAGGSPGALSQQDAQDIVVNNTPAPDNFTGPAQLLIELGIVGDADVAAHKAGIVADLSARDLSIDEDAIQSGSEVDVATCRDSVLNGAS